MLDVALLNKAQNHATSDYFNEKRIQTSDISNELRDQLNKYIAGGNKKETWITMSRRKNSDLGTMNKSIIVEQFWIVMTNIYQLTHHRRE